MEIENKIKEIIAQICETSAYNISNTTSIGDFPQWDSMGHLAILSEVGEHFNVIFEPEELSELEDVNDIINAVKEKIG